MKKISLFALLFIASHFAFSQTCQWAAGFGSSSVGEGSNAVAVDASGNVYATGHYSAAADFDPGPGVTTLTPTGTSDVFIVKLAAAGNLIWARSLDGINNTSDQAIGVDLSGNVYITANFKSTVDVDPGAGTYSLVSSGFDDLFLLKLNSSGNFVWAQAFGSGAGNDYSSTIFVDTAAVYVGGAFTGTVDFDAGAGSSLLTASSGLDGFIYKANLAGNLIWAKQFSGASTQVIISVGIDAAKNVYSTGYHNGSSDFDPGAGTVTLTSAGSADLFLSKLNSSGNYVFAKNIGGAGYDYGSGIVVDKNSNVYIAGSYGGTMDLDPSAGTANYTSAGSQDAFVAKYDNNGNYLWGASVGGASDESFGIIATDTIGNIYNTGGYDGTVDFDPSAATFNLTSSGVQNAFLLKLDWAGNFVWAGNISGGGEYGLGVAADNNNAYVSGGYNATCDFGSGVMLTATGGMQDAFVAKYNFISSGLAEEQQNEIILFPNPVSENLSIDIVDFKNTTLEIYSINGMKIQSRTLSSEHTLINVTEFASGIYVVKITGAKGVSTKRFIKK